jgi:hypothetical protein
VFNTQARARGTPVALVAGRCLLALLASGLGSSVGAPSRNLAISKSRTDNSQQPIANGQHLTSNSQHPMGSSQQPTPSSSSPTSKTSSSVTYLSSTSPTCTAPLEERPWRLVLSPQGTCGGAVGAYRKPAGPTMRWAVVSIFRPLRNKKTRLGQLHSETWSPSRHSYRLFLVRSRRAELRAVSIRPQFVLAA